MPTLIRYHAATGEVQSLYTATTGDLLQAQVQAQDGMAHLLLADTLNAWDVVEHWVVRDGQLVRREEVPRDAPRP